VWLFDTVLGKEAGEPCFGKFVEKPMLSLKRKYLEARAEKVMLGQ
jgi:hypothetical protein